ncbi:MAG: NUDIX domain-containing protein [Candidatus Micrarchaeota archaeon]|nr:NUDIX domain-containing protein [Candidatus Micrarchaeota archaeon]
MANRNDNMFVWVGAMIQNGDKFLFLRRSNHTENWRRKWQLPGGRMEWGESPLDTMRREVMEETGLSLRGPVLAGAYTSMIRSRKGVEYHTLLIVFHARTRSSRVRLSDEHDEYRWMTVREALRSDLFKDLGKFVKEFSET